MINRKFFFDNYIKQFGALSQAQVDNLNGILQAIDNDGTLSKEEIAYIPATSKHESNDTYAPVVEGYWIKKNRIGSLYSYYQKNNPKALKTIFPHGAKEPAYYGRGRVVQLTHNFNYKLASTKIFGDTRLLDNPDMVLDLDTDMKITILGMKEGWFTGHKLSMYFTDEIIDRYNARKIINGLDKAALIAGYAEKFEKCIQFQADSATGKTISEKGEAKEATNEKGSKKK